MTVQTPPPRRTEEEEQRETINAFVTTESGDVIRLRGYKGPNGWQESVELAESIDGETISTLFTGYGLGPTRRYNQIVDAIDAESP